MQKYASGTLPASRTLDAQPRLARQAPLSDLLQAHHCRTLSTADKQIHASAAQRAVDPTSNAKLKTIYDNLLADTTFAALDAIVSPSTHPLKLEESAAIPSDAQYNPATHTIQVNTTGKSDELIANYILWEMHNAKSKTAFDAVTTDINTGFTSGVSLSPDATANTELYLACRALACEWIEWSKLLEHVSRAESINKAKPGTIDNIYKSSFTGGDPTQPFRYGEGWFLFENYLKDQIDGGHTAIYDPSAVKGNAKWRGHFILEKALLSNPPIFCITETQSKMFTIGRLQAMDMDKNIFTTNFMQTLAGKFSLRPEFK